MRKNSARKWLHFTLDLLPVIAIPVFMIYSHRHSLTERTNVEINYKYETNVVNSVDDLVVGNVYHYDYFTYYEGAFDLDLYCLNVDIVNFNDVLLDNVLDELNVASIKDCLFSISFYGSEYSCYFYTDYFNDNYVCFVGDIDNDIIFENVDFVLIDDNTLDKFVLYIDDSSVSLPTFSAYNVIESVNADTTNENILNVFYKDFTDTIDNYFNFDNVFTFGDIWQWFNTNMFGGNASPIAHAIYEIIVYEFIIDIMFLSYCVFMFIIDFTTDTLERFTGWSSRG